MIISVYCAPISIIWDTNPPVDKVQEYRVYVYNGVEWSAPTRVGINAATISANIGDQIAVSAYNGTESDLSNIIVVPFPQSIDGSKITQVSSQEKGSEAIYAIDGDTKTFWKTDIGFKHPHSLTLDLGTKKWINSWTYTPRQDGESVGHIKNHQIHISENGRKWFLATSGTFPNNDNGSKNVGWYNYPIYGRYFRLTVLSSFDGSSIVAAAEIIPVVAIVGPQKPKNPRNNRFLK